MEKKFEDLDDVIDGSDPKKTLKPGYHVCNACIISKKEKQPIEVYSKIYSTISKEFVSTNSYTKESIEEVINKLTDEMLKYASNMEFEKAAELRDKIKELEKGV